MSLVRHIRAYLKGPVVRPWALSAPILVLLICLPMLRPLRHPIDIADDEALRLATITALVNHGALDLKAPPSQVDSRQLLGSAGRIYADQPPMLAVLLTAPAVLMSRLGWSIDDNAAIVVYALTLLGVTLPVAGAAGLLYRMGRLFELPRPWRAGLAIVVVFGSGLATYAVVLNPHAPAAVLVLCAAACLIHVSLAKLPKRGVGWVLLAGASAGLAATLDPPAGIIACLLLLVIATMRMPVAYRALSMLLFVIGAAGPVATHAAWTRPITGEIIPGWREAQVALSLASTRDVNRASSTATTGALDEPDADDVIAAGARWAWVSAQGRWFIAALFGDHGIFTHFPAMILAAFGIAAVMHRHWPSFVKALAASSAISAVLIIAFYGAARAEWHEAMFASRWFIIFLPLLMFWSGAWARRSHSALKWSLAGVLVAFSVAVTLIGMTAPYPRTGFDRYTAVQALQSITRVGSASHGGDPRQARSDDVSTVVPHPP